MKITIFGARQAPGWLALESLVADMLKVPAGEGMFTRIAKKDSYYSGPSDYRGLGSYELTFEYTRFSTPEVEHIELEVR